MIHSKLTKILPFLIIPFLIFACGEIETHGEFRSVMNENFDYPLRSVSQPSEEVLRLTFRAVAELRSLDENSDELREIARFAIEQFEKGEQISTVEIIVEELSASATTTAATRNTYHISTQDL